MHMHMHLPPALFAKTLALLAGFVIASAPAAAETVKGSGVIRTEARAATGFTAVALALPAKVEVSIAAAESVTVEADDNILPLIETTVRNGALHIKPVRENLNLNSRSIRLVVQARSIDQLEIAGSGSMQAEGIRGTRLKLGIGGAGSMDLRQIDTENLELAIGGSGGIRMDGAARRFNANIAGSGDVRAASLVADHAVIHIAGSGAAQIGVRTLLDVSVVGSGSIAYSGDPQVNRSIIGAGSIRRAGPLPQ